MPCSPKLPCLPGSVCNPGEPTHGGKQDDIYQSRDVADCGGPCLGSCMANIGAKAGGTRPPYFRTVLAVVDTWPAGYNKIP